MGVPDEVGHLGVPQGYGASRPGEPAYLPGLGLDGADPAWREYAAGLDARPLRLPTGDALDALLRRLALTDQDRAELPARLDALLADPGTAWLAAAAAAALRDGAGVLRGPYDLPRWPVPPLDHPLGRCVYAAALLATVDEVRAVHARRGAPDEVSWATLAELGRQLRLHRRATGRLGTDEPGWLANAWSGRLLTVGRLQGEYLDDETVGLHIPETGPLAPSSVDASLARLRAGWPTWFGRAPTTLRCDSWLLDPALAGALGPDSNIVRFQRRFRLEDGAAREADGAVLYFVFGRRGIAVPEGLAALPRDTRLQRAVADRLARGGHWQAYEGVLRADA